MASKRPIDTARVLWRAARIVRKRWHRGSFAATQEGVQVAPLAYGARCFCALGALRKAGEVEARRAAFPVVVKGQTKEPGDREDYGWRPVPEREGPSRLDGAFEVCSEASERLFLGALRAGFSGTAAFNDAQDDARPVADLIVSAIVRPRPVATRPDERD